MLTLQTVSVKKKHSEKSSIPPRILVVEDESSIAQAVSSQLQHSGYEVKVTVNGQEALAAIAQQEFDLILLDLVMPGIDGFSVLTQLQQQRNKTPVIVMSNLNQQMDIKMAKELGAEDYFVKAITPLGQLEKEVKKYIAR